jgi:hypothetical protein
MGPSCPGSTDFAPETRSCRIAAPLLMGPSCRLWLLYADTPSVPFCWWPKNSDSPHRHAFRTTINKGRSSKTECIVKSLNPFPEINCFTLFPFPVGTVPAASTDRSCVGRWLHSCWEMRGDQILTLRSLSLSVCFFFKKKETVTCTSWWCSDSVENCCISPGMSWGSTRQSVGQIGFMWSSKCG